MTTTFTMNEPHLPLPHQHAHWPHHITHHQQAIKPPTSVRPLHKKPSERGRRYVPPIEIGPDLPSDDEDISTPHPNQKRIQVIEGNEMFQAKNFERKPTDRTELQHYLVKQVWGSNFSSPIEQILKTGARVLDVGCGSGAWVHEMGIDYPQSIFTGIDKSANYAVDDIHGNTSFFQHDILQGVPFPDNTFDFVHMRFLNLYLTEAEWSGVVLKDLMRVLKPGGYLELCESDLQYINAGDATHRLNRVFRSAYKRKGVNPVMSGNLARLLRDLQMEDVQSEEKPIPLGTWNGELGELAKQGVMKTLRSAREQISRLMSIAPEEYDKICQIVFQEYDENKTLFPTSRTYGMKLTQ